MILAFISYQLCYVWFSASSAGSNVQRCHSFRCWASSLSFQCTLYVIIQSRIIRLVFPCLPPLHISFDGLSYSCESPLCLTPVHFPWLFPIMYIGVLSSILPITFLLLHVSIQLIFPISTVWMPSVSLAAHSGDPSIYSVYYYISHKCLHESSDFSLVFVSAVIPLFRTSFIIALSFVQIQCSIWLLSSVLICACHIS